MRHTERILAIGAHPDDVEYGCLGTLIRNTGSSRVLICSYGTIGDPTYGHHRFKESQDCIAAANDKIEVVFLGGDAAQKSKFPSFKELVDKFENHIKDFDPTAILVHSAKDTHQEHRAVNEAAVTAARRHHGSLMFYMSPSSTLDFRPNYFMTLSDSELKQKIEALGKHQSQADRPYLEPGRLEHLHRHFFSTNRGASACEGFELQYAIV